jgi:hypothetical protein
MSLSRRRPNAGDRRRSEFKQRLGNSNESFETASGTQQTNFDMRHKITVGDRT